MRRSHKFAGDGRRRFNPGACTSASRAKDTTFQAKETSGAEDDGFPKESNAWILIRSNPSTVAAETLLFV